MEVYNLRCTRNSINEKLFIATLTSTLSQPFFRGSDCRVDDLRGELKRNFHQIGERWTEKLFSSQTWIIPITGSRDRSRLFVYLVSSEWMMMAVGCLRSKLEFELTCCVRGFAQIKQTADWISLKTEASKKWKTFSRPGSKEGIWGSTEIEKLFANFHRRRQTLPNCRF